MAGTQASDRDGVTRSSRRFLSTAFALVALMSLLATGFAIVQARRLERQGRGLVTNALTSIRLAGQLEDQIQKRRILIDNHIFAERSSEMAALDREIAAIDADVSSRLASYGARLSAPAEREAWADARAGLAALEGPVSQALAVSRQNRDHEARQMMDRVAGQFAGVERDIDELVAINDRSAAESAAQLANIRHRLVQTLFGIGIAFLIVLAFVARWSMQQITRHEEEMRVYARRLEAQNRELDAFAGRVAHDIRGGLTTISLAMTPLSAKVPEDDNALQILRRGTKRMEALVEDLLTLARVEGEVRGHCDPAAVATQIAEEVAPRAEEAHVALRVSVAPADVACSEGLLRQAVMNLVDNAVKYRRPDASPAPEVVVSGRPTDGTYDLQVSDNGLGMSRDDSRHAGEPFFRAARTRKVPGTGLGLSIVNRVVEASGGSLSMSSRVGEGSTFVIHLPLAHTEDAAGGEGRA